MRSTRLGRRRSARFEASISRFGVSGQDNTRPAGEPIATDGLRLRGGLLTTTIDSGPRTPHCEGEFQRVEAAVTAAF
jgi:hypothetical protein